MNPHTATLQAEVPSRLLSELHLLVDSGWFRSLDDVVTDALRRFVESHRVELPEELTLEDMDWGLRGDD